MKWIMSQSGLDIIDPSKMEGTCINRNNTKTIVIYSNPKNYTELGTYQTPQRAKKVLAELFDYINNQDQYSANYKMPDS